MVDINGGGFTLYTTIPISQAPYPHGLGKIGHEELETDMKQLLGIHHGNQTANEQAFWTPRYQRLLNHHLKPFFDPAGDIVEIARQATAHAHSNPVLNQRLPSTPDAQIRYRAQMPTLGPEVPQEVVRWRDHPPEITRYADGVTRYGNGRHRLSYLRSRIQPIDPNFQVLVKLDHIEHQWS
ncbi:hypothetical protein [Mycobacterium hubeiense]|uniref:hypothetical protein n=1 Tax=Mycobacterium hubeiense TaxID=1867256 RepID=UPI000C7F1842|nr:hypothetical protein [Mycobacterium sp. QGD 101]